MMKDKCKNYKNQIFLKRKNKKNSIRLTISKIVYQNK